MPVPVIRSAEVYDIITTYFQPFGSYFQRLDMNNASAGGGGAHKGVSLGQGRRRANYAWSVARREHARERDARYGGALRRRNVADDSGVAARWRLLGLPLALAVVLAIFFVWLALEVRTVEGLQAVDQALFDGLRAGTLPGFVDFLLLKGSWFADLRVTAILAVGAAAALVSRRAWRPAILVLGSVGTAYLAAGYFKELLEVPRPPVSEHAFPLGGYGFPSSHATLSVALYAPLAALAVRPAVLLLKRVASPDRREIRLCAGAVLSGGLLTILLVGISRVYRGVHYPTDVVGGYLLGALAVLLIGALLYGGPSLLRRRFPKASADG